MREEFARDKRLDARQRVLQDKERTRLGCEMAVSEGSDKALVVEGDVLDFSTGPCFFRIFWT